MTEENAKLRCMNCARIIKKGEEYKQEPFSKQPVGKCCWKIYEKFLCEQEIWDDLDNWEEQGVMIR